MTHWAYDAVFYHIYPLGMCGAPRRNDFRSPPVPRLAQIHGWIPHLVDLGVNALYLGPVFESTSHGYDTADYNLVDRRLGDEATLAELVRELHRHGIRVILDGVFHHVGRDFWAFRDLQRRLKHSAYRDWFAGLRFDRRSRHGDPFTYAGWKGHTSLVRLNLANTGVRHHLFDVIAHWIETYDIDGFRLDAADCIAPAFLRELGAFCRTRRPEFWLMGEVVHGDYRNWVQTGMLDAVTNYECYHELWTSHVDRDYAGIARSLERQFGERGCYRTLPLYNFADNHDVNRVAGMLEDPVHLYPLYCLLFTMPGIPSIYYGSEWGLAARRTDWDDRPLRPHLDLDTVRQTAPHPDLVATIRRLSEIRRRTPALRYGGYAQLHVSREQLAFARTSADDNVIVVINAAPETAAVDIPVPAGAPGTLHDLLNPGAHVAVRDGRAHIHLWPRWGRILR